MEKPEERVYAEELNPWDKQEWETGAQYTAFWLYLAQGVNRTIRKTMQDYYGSGLEDKNDLMSSKGNSGSSIYLWRRNNEWEKRVKAFDDFMLSKAEVEAPRIVNEARAYILANALPLVQKLLEGALEGGIKATQLRAIQFALDTIGIKGDANEIVHKFDKGVLDELLGKTGKQGG